MSPKTATQSSTSVRPPIVVVMGHVDHGKSTLLDYVRKTNIVATEAGGITQHVAAYEVEHDPPAGRQGEKIGKRRVTFIDTPGHAAFQAIRARGANVADIAILVVAADDGVKAQTLEALAQIREAKIPFLVAINKIDKANADITRTQTSLLEQQVFLEGLGGDVPWVPISAKQGTGIPELLDLVLLIADLNEHTASSAEPAAGYVIEAHRDPKRGIAATLIIKSGTLESGMAVVAGRALAPVRIMENHAGKPLKSATFSTPVRLVGFDDLPAVGSEFKAYKNKKDAEAARQETLATEVARAGKQTVTGEKFLIPVIVRADTSGSLDAIALEISRLETERSGIHVLQSGIGTITEGDVKTAAASSENPGIVIGFNVPVDALARDRARGHGIAIETFDIIYKLTERLETLLSERTPKQLVETIIGRARVLKIFSSQKETHVVGGKVQEGKLEKGAQVRVMRRAIAVGNGTLTNLQSNKQNLDRVETDAEFGAQIDAPFEIAPGDLLECVTEEMK